MKSLWVSLYAAGQLPPVDLALSWLASGRMRAEGIITPIVEFADSAEAYRVIERATARKLLFDDTTPLLTLTAP